MYLSLSLYIYIYIYTHLYTYMGEAVVLRKGTSGVSTNGVTAISFMFFDRGTFWLPSFTYFYLPKSASAYLFPQPVNIHHFCSGPISVDPICPQPNYVCTNVL